MINLRSYSVNLAKLDPGRKDAVGGTDSVLTVSLSSSSSLTSQARETRSDLALVNFRAAPIVE